ncbi:MAG: (2Fe-2S)-binding protein [Betaproteobacteria bacterium]|nr:(2Fe-2S)-binding protein [Betaproteobacteria bacterium]
MIAHVLLGLVSIASRHSLAMSRTDVVQLVLGLLTPPLLLSHVIAMSMTARLVSEFVPSYGQILAVYWKFAPALAFQQLFAVIFVWIHGAIGLYTWLVLKPVWKRIGAVVLPLLFAVPILALLGFAEAGKEVLGKLATDAAWREDIEGMIEIARPAKEELDALQALVLTGYGALFLLALAVYVVRRLRARLVPVRVAYDGGESAAGVRGLSILELSRTNGIAHADVCSGHGRCGTCRVRVEAGADHLSPRNDIEVGTLARVGAGEHDRLACPLPGWREKPRPLRTIWPRWQGGTPDGESCRTDEAAQRHRDDIRRFAFGPRAGGQTAGYGDAPAGRGPGGVGGTPSPRITANCAS